MSQDRLELVIRPLAQKVMDLTLGRYQVLEHHRHKIPEFLSMCSGDVENILTALCNLDVERATNEARLIRQVQGTVVKRQEDVRAKDDAADDDDADGGGALDARGRALDEAEEQARIQALRPEAYIEELKTQIQRLRTGELYLRSTLSDVLHELDTKTTALCTKEGQINHRNQRLARQREAFLRENRQLRDIVAQFREKGKCDFPDPTLYDWDADSNADGEGGSSRTGGKAAVKDPLQQLRLQMQDEKETMEKTFAKQLEEARFKLRTLEAQAVNAARTKVEQQQRIAALQEKLDAMEQHATATSLNDDGETGAGGAGGHPHDDEGGVEASTSLAPLAAQGTTAIPPVAPAAAVLTVDVGVQVDALQPAAVGGGVVPAVGPSSTSLPLPVSPCFAMEVDPALQHVLLARQVTPDGLGAGVARSVSTTGITPLSPKKAGDASSNQKTIAGGKSVKSGGGSKQGSHKAPPNKAPRGPPPSDLHVDGSGGQGSAEWADSLSDPTRRPADDDDQHRRGEEPLGASPWSEDLRPAGNTSSALESSAHTPSQLEALKLLEEEHLQQRGAGGLLSLPGSGIVQSGVKRQPTAAKIHTELQNLRAENRSLREASGKLVGSSGACSAPHNNTAILLARLKEELHNKSSLLEERSAELEQLKMETMRWFDAYKRGIPPPNALPVGLFAPTKPSQHNDSGPIDLVVNYGTAARLKATVAAAEDAEERYRVGSWKLLTYHLRGSMVMEAHLADMHRADKARHVPELCLLQAQLERLDHQQRRVLVRLRTSRATARADANMLWDKVLTLARGVCQLDDVDPSASGGTPRYYLRSPRKPAGSIETQVRQATVGIGSDDTSTEAAKGASEQHSIYFRAVSSAAAAYTVQHAAAGTTPSSSGGGFAASIPIRGVSAASVHTLLPQRPQRPQSASSAQDGTRSGPTGVMPSRLRASVTRPQSALMLKHSAGNQHHGQSTAATAATASSQLPPPSALHALQGFDPTLQQATSSSGPVDRRAVVLAAMAKDKKLAAQEKLQLVEERRLLRASACATRAPDLARPSEPLIHMARLVGRNE